MRHECARCFDEFGSYTCLRPAHTTNNEPNRCLACGEGCPASELHFHFLKDRASYTPSPGPYHEKCCPLCEAPKLKPNFTTIVGEIMGKIMAREIDRAIRGEPKGKPVGILPTPEAPDFYLMAANAFGMTREEAKRRILEAMTTETPAGKRRRELRAFIAQLRDGITLLRQAKGRPRPGRNKIRPRQTPPPVPPGTIGKKPNHTGTPSHTQSRHLRVRNKPCAR